MKTFIIDRYMTIKGPNHLTDELIYTAIYVGPNMKISTIVSKIDMTLTVTYSTIDVMYLEKLLRYLSIYLEKETGIKTRQLECLISTKKYITPSMKRFRKTSSFYDKLKRI